MALTAQGIAKLVGVGRCLGISRLVPQRFSSLWTPDYLELKKSAIPLHPLLNIKLQGYSYPVLENYQKFIGALANNLEIEVEDGWAFPPKCLIVNRFKVYSSAVDCTYNVSEYQRNIQIEVSALQLPIFLRALEASLPEGVTLSIENFDPEFELKRYVPDTELLNLRKEIDEIGKK